MPKGIAFGYVWGRVDYSKPTKNHHCCDVCDTKTEVNDCNAELCTLIDAVDTVGERGS